ncbi:MAG TPA: hypothetical protein VI248_16715 [Kineosporiaceae bacterium]
MTVGDATAPAADAAGDADRIVQAMVDAYRRRGYHQVNFPASALLVAVDALDRLEGALATLLDARHLVPAGTSEVALHPSARLALLSRSVLARWFEAFSQEGPTSRARYTERVTSELTMLVRWACDTAGAPDELLQRAAELAGVLATVDLDPAAFEVVGKVGGTPRARLEALATVPARSLDLDGLLVRLRRNVSTR